MNTETPSLTSLLAWRLENAGKRDKTVNIKIEKLTARMILKEETDADCAAIELASIIRSVGYNVTDPKAVRANELARIILKRDVRHINPYAPPL